MPNSQKLIIDLGFYHIRQIFAKLFAKNMKGGSDKFENLCVGQLAHAEKKSGELHFCQRPSSWGKYLPNISLSFITRKYLQLVLREVWSPPLYSHSADSPHELQLIFGNFTDVSVYFQLVPQI